MLFQSQGLGNIHPRFLQPGLMHEAQAGPVPKKIGIVSPSRISYTNPARPAPKSALVFYVPPRSGGSTSVSRILQIRLIVSNPLLSLSVVIGFRVFLTGQLQRPPAQCCVQLQWPPANSLLQLRHLAHRILPFGSGERNRRRLDGALNEQAVSGPALSCARDLPATPKHI